MKGAGWQSFALVSHDVCLVYMGGQRFTWSRTEAAYLFSEGLEDFEGHWVSVEMTQLHPVA